MVDQQMVDEDWIKVGLMKSGQPFRRVDAMIVVHEMVDGGWKL